MKRMLLVLAVLAAPIALQAQRGGGAAAGQRGAAPSAQATAPVDLTGYWVSLITDNWTSRVITPKKGDVNYLPVNPEGRRVADAWDPAKDEAAGQACKAYGPPGLMRSPTRLHITWENENTLKLEADNGQQTRLFHFGAAPPPAESSLQGYSAAQWQLPGGGRGGRRGGADSAASAARPGASMKAVTTKMMPGYYQKNGVPYGANAVLTEYFTTIGDRGAQYLLATISLEDPQYLTQSFLRTSEFKKEPDGSKWDPQPCSAR